MHNGTILYHTGDTNPSAGTSSTQLRAAGLDPRWTEWATDGPASINDALLRLATRGAHRVEAVNATLTPVGDVELGTAWMRLFG